MRKSSQKTMREMELKRLRPLFMVALIEERRKMMERNMSVRMTEVK